MTADDVTKIIQTELSGVEGTSDVRAALVEPYRQQFLLMDSYEQMSSAAKSVVEYWVVAATPMYLEFFDPHSQEFGLAEPLPSEGLPQTVGVRGDLVSTFRAM